MTKSVKYFLLTALVMMLSLSTAHAANVVVTITNVENNHGVLRVFLCRANEFLSEHCNLKTTVSAQQGVMKIVIKKVPPGNYAIQIHHDANNNGKMDWRMMGIIPAEGYGFSRLGEIFSEPEFKDAEFKVVNPQTDMSVTLNYP